MSNFLGTCRDGAQSTPLHKACANDNTEVAMALVDRGADVDARNLSQRTSLHAACGISRLQLISY